MFSMVSRFAARYTFWVWPGKVLRSGTVVHFARSDSVSLIEVFGRNVRDTISLIGIDMPLIPPAQRTEI